MCIALLNGAFQHETTKRLGNLVTITWFFVFVLVFSPLISEAGKSRIKMPTAKTVIGRIPLSVSQMAGVIAYFYRREILSLVFLVKAIYISNQKSYI